MSFLRYALVTVPLVLLLGMISGRISNAGSANLWFAALTKPAIMPPGWAFGLAWTILYILLGFVLAMVLHARGARGRGVALGAFLVQLALNFAWSPVFFGLNEPRAALVMILVMLALSVVAAVLFWWIRRAAALLMLPYIAWLCFAALLTYQIIGVNRGALELVPREGSADIVL
jgi:tryptophan-rich sensory protein